MLTFQTVLHSAKHYKNL